MSKKQRNIILLILFLIATVVVTVFVMLNQPTETPFEVDQTPVATEDEPIVIPIEEPPSSDTPDIG